MFLGPDPRPVLKEIWMADGATGKAKRIMVSDTSEVQDFFAARGPSRGLYRVELDPIITLGDVSLLAITHFYFTPRDRVTSTRALYAYSEATGLQKVMEHYTDLQRVWSEENVTFTRGYSSAFINLNVQTLDTTVIGIPDQNRYYTFTRMHRLGDRTVFARSGGGETTNWYALNGPLALPSLLGQTAGHGINDDLFILPLASSLHLPSSASPYEFSRITSDLDTSWVGRLSEYATSLESIRLFNTNRHLLNHAQEKDSLWVIADRGRVTKKIGFAGLIYNRGYRTPFHYSTTPTHYFFPYQKSDSSGYLRLDTSLSEPLLTRAPDLPAGHQRVGFVPFRDAYYFLDHAFHEYSDIDCREYTVDGTTWEFCDTVPRKVPVVALVRLDPASGTQRVVRFDTCWNPLNSQPISPSQLRLFSDNSRLYYNLPAQRHTNDYRPLLRSEGTSETTQPVAGTYFYSDRGRELVHGSYGMLFSGGSGRRLYWLPIRGDSARNLSIPDEPVGVEYGLAQSLAGPDQTYAILRQWDSRGFRQHLILSLTSESARLVGTYPDPTATYPGLLTDGRILLIGEDRSLHAIDPRTGDMEYLHTLPAVGATNDEPTYVLQNDVLYYLQYKGPDVANNLVYYDVGRQRSGTIVAPPDVVALFQPILVDGTVYLGGISDRYGRNPYYLDTLSGRLVSGVVFVDSNKNGRREAGEPGIAGQLIRASGAVHAAVTADPEGHYELAIPTAGKTTLALADPDCSPGSGYPAGGRVELPPGEADVTQHFPFTAGSGPPDIEVLASTARLRCGFTTPFWITARNRGCATFTGHLRVNLPAGSTLVEADSTFQPLDDGAYGWDIRDLPPQATYRIRCLVRLPNEDLAGEILETKLTVTSAEREVTRAVFRETLFCAYDPNDKQTVPNRRDPENRNYTLYDEWITYKIRFQNTGNDTAFTVRLADHLSPYLDPQTLTPLDASHPYTYALSDAGLATFTFHDILLPDSTTNEALSHGFVRFRILPHNSRSKRSDRTIVHNQAAIYFDFNRPIITNRTTNTLVATLDQDGDGAYFWEDCNDNNAAVHPAAEEIPGNTIDENCDGETTVTAIFEPMRPTVSIYPNPSSGRYILAVGNSEGTILAEVYAVTGRLITRRTFVDRLELDLAGAPNGIYVVRLTSTTGQRLTSTHRITKQ